MVSLETFKPHEEQLYSRQSKESVYAENFNLKLLEELTEKSSLLGLIDYFRTLKAFTILFLLIVCMSYVAIQNRNVLGKKIPTSPNSDDIKTSLRKHLRYFKMTIPLLQVLQKSLPIPMSLSHIQ